MKKQLRVKIVKKRENLSKEFIKEYSEDLSEIFFNSEIYKNSKTIMSYVSFRGEFDTQFINQKILEDKKILLLPKIYKDGIIKAFEVRDLTKLRKNNFGIEEPIENQEKIPDLVIVPGVAFDFKGNRLGFGGGFYDRFLKEKDFSTVAFCYDFQIIETVPKEEHDIPVNTIYYLENSL